MLLKKWSLEKWDTTNSFISIFYFYFLFSIIIFLFDSVLSDISIAVLIFTYSNTYPSSLYFFSFLLLLPSLFPHYKLNTNSFLSHFSFTFFLHHPLTSLHINSYHLILYLILSYLISFLILSYLISYLILSYHILPYLALSFLISYLILYYLI